MAAKAKTNDAGSERIYVICGKDKFLVSGECQKLLETLLSPEERSLSLFQPEVDKVEISEVLDELRTLPFLADKRVALLKGADSFITANRPALEKYFAEPSRCGVLILVVQKWQKSTRLAKMLGKVGKLIDVGDIGRYQLAGYVSNYITSTHGKSMNHSTASMLVELVGDDVGRLCSEADKLAIYVDQRKKIELADVEALIGHNRMFGAFSVIDAITDGRIDTAVERLRNMFMMDRSAEFTVVGAFAFHFRKMFRAKALLEKGVNAQQIIGQLRVFGNKDGFFRQVRALSLRQIGRVLCELARIDHGMKTGQTTVPVAIERLVVRLGAAIAQASQGRQTRRYG